MRPLLFLDVDGVVSPFGASEFPPHFVEELINYPGGLDYLPLSQTVAAWLRQLEQLFEMWWATWWGEDANHFIAPALRIDPYPVLELSDRLVTGQSYKGSAIQLKAGARPLAWVDDEIDSDDTKWAERRREPTLLLQTECSVGITEEQVDELKAFAGNA